MKTLFGAVLFQVERNAADWFPRVQPAAQTSGDDDTKVHKGEYFETVSSLGTS